MNVDITVVLEEEQVDALIAVADKEGSTLSALFRDMVASYMGEHAAAERACLWALRRQFHKTITTQETEKLDDTEQSEVQSLRDEIAALRKLITEHLVHHNETGFISQPQEQKQNMPKTLFEDIQTSVSPPVTIDETMLGKKREPVSPVIEAPTYGSFHDIEDNKEYSVDEVSAYLGLSAVTVRKYARDGKISSQKKNRAYVFLGKDVREYILTSSHAKG
ncbi:MAG: helix-turn-helix domain-containing protein [Methanomicrobiales archaeon]|jgi:DNA-binding transcriptional MerR regulator|nr:helix-turn-helix domain-containing protein [Methanomicrobiales archaeon]